MPKPRSSLKVRLPAYAAPRNAWRRQIHAAFLREADARGVTYGEGDKLEVHVRLYLDGTSLAWHDVDNRLKDILDALQGRAGGSKRERLLKPVIPNDRQVFRVSIENAVAPKQSRGLGHVFVRRFRDRGTG